MTDEAQNSDKILSFEDILAAQDIVEETLSIPEWGGNVRIRSLTKAQQQVARRKSTNSKGELDGDRLELAILVNGMVEPRLTMAEAPALRKKSAGVLDRIAMKIMEISGMNQEALLAEEAVEEAEEWFQDES